MEVFRNACGRLRGAAFEPPTNRSRLKKGGGSYLYVYLEDLARISVATACKAVGAFSINVLVTGPRTNQFVSKITVLIRPL